MSKNKKLAIIGTGNLGSAIARGLKESGSYKPKNIMLTRRHLDRIAEFAEMGFKLERDNLEAVDWADLLIITVEPQQMDRLVDEIRHKIEPQRHIIISCVTGVSIAQMKSRLPENTTLVRAMPNTGVAVLESMTCLASEGNNGLALRMAEEIFQQWVKRWLLKKNRWQRPPLWAPVAWPSFYAPFARPHRAVLRLAFRRTRRFLLPRKLP